MTLSNESYCIIKMMSPK